MHGSLDQGHRGHIYVETPKVVGAADLTTRGTKNLRVVAVTICCNICIGKGTCSIDNSVAYN